MKTKILLFFCLPLFLYAESFLISLSDYFHERTKQYPLPEGKKILVATPPRTGSTFIYNVLKFLFEDANCCEWINRKKKKVLKGHPPLPISAEYYYVSTVRDPVDAALSYLRVFANTNRDLPPRFFFEKGIASQVEGIEFIEELKQRSVPLLVLHYEDFAENWDFLFAQIEKEFSITIAPQDKKYLEKTLSKQNVLNHISKFASFDEYDSNSLFHGDHVQIEKHPEEIETDLRKESKSLLRPYADLFSKYGYFIDVDQG